MCKEWVRAVRLPPLKRVEFNIKVVRFYSVGIVARLSMANVIKSALWCLLTTSVKFPVHNKIPSIKVAPRKSGNGNNTVYSDKNEFCTSV